ncbi:MAG TPA: pyridoxal-dependent decarboxylase [Longimicrobiales bacterium]|nr:pyridoxal-dependent decarboxylase [Longimicrobiales bacterium]
MTESLAPDPGLAAFRQAGHELIDWVADYLQHAERYPVLPRTQPGELRAALPAAPPLEPEPLDAILADFHRYILPNTTHWNHPGFMAYFAVSGSPPGILAELLIAALNVNAMVWRTGPAATELEEVTLAWLRDLLGLPAEFDGTINDTASSSTLYALAAAREKLNKLHLHEEGLAGRPEVPPLCVYCSEEAHTSVDKATIALGLGRANVRRIPTTHDYTMDVDALHVAIAADIRAGRKPMAVVATVGTTSATAVDPVNRIADVCARHDIWLHVDGAYGGSAAVLPEMRWVLEGCERAHSIVVNPHKWLLVPIDCSVLYTREPALLRAAFTLTHEYLKTPEEGAARNLMDYGISLGRRFRALKLWFVMRAYGVEGIRAHLREHIRLARMFADWVDAHPEYERLAPTRFSVVVFRHVPPHLAGKPDELDRHNLALLERVNSDGAVFPSHTRTKGRLALRIAIGNQRTREEHVRKAWELVQQHAGEITS